MWLDEPDQMQPLTRTSHYIPADGAFVVFTLDPAATVEALKDPIAQEEARALQTRKYIGYVTQVFDLPLPTRRYHRCSCYILSQGPSRMLPSHNRYVDELMCTAVAPAEHPAGRPSIEPSPALPWQNLYLHSISSFYLRLKTAPGKLNHETSPMLPLCQYLDVMEYTNADAMRQQRIVAGFPEDTDYDTESLGPPSSLVTSPSSCVPCVPADNLQSSFTDLCNDDRQTVSDSGSTSGSETDSMGIDSLPEALVMAFSPGEHPSNDLIPVAAFDLDISTVKEFADADGMEEEIEAINA
ncbi:hypothetical protein FA95DRAFT_1500547 [Auriscalpium vulgare]|uniref:Uncharacterized protein n=1 Tax=Auriscalpium vulgare TaxID=40419 RepID=A0ACB8RD62_9AGAM|nr:hypothetical protein FA95DRAFT_1500547 [Auriscalpium vulgare]